MNNQMYIMIDIFKTIYFLMKFKNKLHICNIVNISALQSTNSTKIIYYIQFIDIITVVHLRIRNLTGTA